MSGTDTGPPPALGDQVADRVDDAAGRGGPEPHGEGVAVERLDPDDRRRDLRAEPAVLRHHELRLASQGGGDDVVSLGLTACGASVVSMTWSASATRM